MARRRFKKVAKDKETGVAKKYLSGAKNKSAKAKKKNFIKVGVTGFYKTE